MSTVGSADEPMLARELGWLKHQLDSVPLEERLSPSATFFRWARVRLAALYRQKGDVVTSLCLNDLHDPAYLDPRQIDRLVQYMEKPNKTAFESLAASMYPVPVSELRELKALNALYRGDLKTAAKLFEAVSPKQELSLNADPFLIHIQDCHDCDAEAQGSRYTKVQLVRRMAEMLGQAEANPAKAPELYFEIGNALYNITYYGNSRAMYGTRGFHFAEVPPTFDTSHAEAYYRKALELSRNREFQAKAAFMAAKCELGAFYNSRGQWNPGVPDFKAGVWFHKLRDSYSDTRYYQEIIRECGYFRTFVGK